MNNYRQSLRFICLIFITLLALSCMKLPYTISLSPEPQISYKDSNGAKWIITPYDPYRTLDPIYWFYFPKYIGAMINHKIYDGEGSWTFYKIGLYKQVNDQWQLWNILESNGQDLYGGFMAPRMNDDDKYIYILFKRKSLSNVDIELIRVDKARKGISEKIKIPYLKASKGIKPVMSIGTIEKTLTKGLLIMVIECLDDEYLVYYYLIDLQSFSSKVFCRGPKLVTARGFPKAVSAYVEEDNIYYKVTISKKVNQKWVDTVVEDSIRIYDTNSKKGVCDKDVNP